MVQIIKGTEKPVSPTLALNTPSFIIKGSVIEEQKAIEALQAQTEQDKQKILAEFESQKATAQTEGTAQGTTQAMSEAALLAISIFTERAKSCQELEEPLMKLAREIAQKILGGSLELAEDKQKAFVQEAISKIRSRRKLKLQTTSPESFSHLKNLPDFEVELANDLAPGLLRVVTEVGPAVCNQTQALEQLQAV